MLQFFESEPGGKRRGLLKEEMRRFHSLLMECADQTQVPAGGALAVDRDEFSSLVTRKIKGHENIQVVSREVTDFPCPTPRSRRSWLPVL